MGEATRHAVHILENLLQGKKDLSNIADALSPKHHPPEKAFPASYSIEGSAIEKRRSLLGISENSLQALLPSGDLESLECYTHNIENLIGVARIPIGVAGPLRVNGLYAQGDYTIPLATHEAALVASYHRGACAITAAGGCTSVLLNEAVSRSPGFVFENLRDAGRFLAWALPLQEQFRKIAEATTQHGKLLDIHTTIEGNDVYLRFDYQTGDAAGQNMVTIATQAVCDYIHQHSPVRPKAIYVEANQSGDKKACAQSFQYVRGKKVTCEIEMSSSVLKRFFNATAAQMTDYWRISAVGSALSGTIGLQGHYANGLTALFLACGQDAACVAEAAVGITRFETREDSLYATVTLPNLIVGTVGGGTGLPSQRACLEILGLYGTGHAKAFAEVCAGVVLAGELSIIAAIATGSFSRAHKVLARARKRNES